MTLWPDLNSPADLPVIEQTPLAHRGLPTSTFDSLRRSALASPQRLALRVLPDADRWETPDDLTYGQLLERVIREANTLAALGVGRTDAVGLLSVNTTGLISALLAAQAVGVAAPVNPVLNPEHVGALLRRAGVRVLIASGPELQPQVWELARSMAAELGLEALLALQPVDAVGVELEPIDGVRVAYLDSLSADQDGSSLSVPEPRADDLAAFFHTGGTTGTPKLAVHTHAMEVADAWAVALTKEHAADDFRLFSALPLFHVNALIVTTLAPLMRAQTVVWAGPLGYRDPGLAKNFWKIVEHFRIGGMSAVPAVYAALSRVPVDADLSSLWLCVVGAAPLPPAVRQGWQEHTGIALSEGYGLTEATCASARSLPGYARSDSVGMRMPYQALAAVEVDDTTGEWRFLPPGETGTIVVNGPVVFPGYLVGRDGPRVLIDAGDKVRDGWLDTGDLGSVTADGYLRLSGRAKDIIIRGGHNIDPAPVETVLMQHPAVRDAAVVGRPDPHAGEVPVAFVCVSDPNADPDEIRRWASVRVPEPAAAPKHVTVLPDLPLTAVGKPFKVELRRHATQDELAERLRALGCPAPEGQWCHIQDGHVVVSLPAPEDPELKAAVESVLNAYAMPWRLT
ncbi:MAG TPA: acyl-CoA synthetase [Actinomycetota bacterium]|nr:acyl-CoA synthetase [Actinomycetota bacterium]